MDAGTPPMKLTMIQCTYLHIGMYYVCSTNICEMLRYALHTKLNAEVTLIIMNLIR